MLRRGRLVLLLAISLAAVVALAAPGPASARVTPRGSQWRVLVLNKISDSTFAALARRGAVGLMRPGYGPTTNRQRALAELVRGAETNARLGGVPPGKPLIGFDTASGARTPNCRMCIVLELPPRGAPIANNRLYRIAIVGQDFHGLLTSPTTQIPGLISIVDVAPTVLPGHQATALSWAATSNPIGQLAHLNQQIGSNNRLKFAVLFVLAGLLLLLALLGLRAAVTAVPAALAVNLLLGIGQVSNEVLLVAGISAGTALLAFGLARVCRSDNALLALYGGIVFLYAVVMVARPEWQAINPFGPTQNSRFWGIGNQLETLLLAPLLAGAVLARRRFGILGFALFGLFGLAVITDNHFGADGGGAIVLGIALAVLGTRLFRLRVAGFVGLLAASALTVLWLVSRGLAQPGPDHLRSAFAGGAGGLLKSLESRVPLAYVPALHAWEMVVPLLAVLVAAYVVAWRRAKKDTRDVLLALGVAIVTSLLVNDSAAYELVGGIAVVGAVARFAPTSAPVRVRVPVPAWVRVPAFRKTSAAPPETVAAESPPG
jgi:hypothetical protein